MLRIQPEIQHALRHQKPVIALESTIITHGMPYPQNVETALKVEKAVRDNGAVPATIAIVGGVLRVGLDLDDITLLGQAGQGVLKTSRRDLPYVVSRKKNGATTVAATMIIAEMAGLSIFATGGIGGVHRGATASMDISADLQELGRTNVAVVSAGAKAILDIPLTLEYLETMGVPVIGYKCDEFPSFYSRESGQKVDCRLNTPSEIAAYLLTKWQMKLEGGVLIANPIPKRAAMAYEAINPAIEQAVEEAGLKGIKGKDITPFLLGRIVELTGGKSLEANIQLILNNAALAARIAAAMIIEKDNL